MASPSIPRTYPKRAPPRHGSAWWSFVDQYWLPALVLVFVCGPLLHIFPLHRYYPLDRYHNRGGSEYHASSVAMRRLQEGIAKCNSHNQTQPSNQENRSLLRKNPRVSLTANETFIIRNAILFDGIRWTEDVVDVFISDGIVQAVNKSIHPDTLVNYEIDYEIDAMGSFLTPGLVDMHSHSTLYPLPATKDYIELFDLMSEGTEFVQVMDSIFPSDPMVPIIASGGVTTSLILPGSTNIIGGQGLAIKNRVPKSLSVVDMQVEYRVKQPQKHLKMACGYNPKAFHRDFQERPGSRMGIAWWWRDHFRQAKQLKEKQELWCENALNNRSYDIEELKSYPEDDKLEMAIGALRKPRAVKIHVHCSASQDIEALLRIAEEFDFRVDAIHHGNDAHLIPTIIKRPIKENQVTLAIWAFYGLSVMENYRTSVYGGKILAENDIPIAYKSDHPWVNAKHLIYEAAIGHSVGLEEQIALRAVTSTPAKAIGLDHRIGYVRPGYDADLVLWDSHPLQIGATPIDVWIDGVALYNVTKATRRTINKEKPKARRYTTSQERSSCEKGAKSMVVTGLRESFLKIPGQDLPHAQNGNPFQMVIKKGKISCIGFSCSKHVEAAIKIGAKILKLEDGYLVPGAIAASKALGLSEIDFEISTQDGAFAPASPFSPTSVPYAKYGINFGGKHMDYARRGGVLTSITAPNNLGLASGPPTPMRGVSTFFRTGGKNVLDRSAMPKEEVALHVVIGHASQQNGDRPISVQIASLRASLIDNSGFNNPFGHVYSGKLPLVIETNNEGVIAQMIKLKNEFSNLRLVIHGGAEAWKLDKELAASNVPVILAPWRCTPWTWEEKNCLPGPPHTQSGIEILHKAGVKLGIAMKDDALHSRLWIEAGWAKRWGNMTEQEAANLISYNIEDMLGLKKSMDPASNFVLFEGNPLKFGARIAVIFEQQGDNGEVVDCWPELEGSSP